MRSFRPGFIVVGIKMRAFKREGGEGGGREGERERYIAVVWLSAFR